MHISRALKNGDFQFWQHITFISVQFEGILRDQNCPRFKFISTFHFLRLLT